MSMPMLVKVGTAIQAGSGNVVPVVPVGDSAGRMYVLFINSADNVVCSVSGWTNEIATNTGTVGRFEAWYLRSNTAPSNPTVTHTAGGAITGIIYSFDGCVLSGDPFSTTSTSANTASLTITATTISPKPGDLLLFAGAICTSGGTSGSAQGISGYASTTYPSAKWTEKSDTDNTNGVNDNNLSIAIARSTGDLTNSVTATEAWSYSAASSNNVGALLALTGENKSFQPNYLRPAIFKPGLAR